MPRLPALAVSRRALLRGAAATAAVAASLAAVPPAFAADKLTVLLDWFVNPDHAPLVVAAQQGFFADEGLDVELVPPSDPAAPPRLVAAGQADVAVTYQPSLYEQVAAEMPLARFGTLVETPLNTVIVLADGPVKTLADLKGRTIGFSVAGFEDVLLSAMLRSAGLTPADVKVINVNFALSSSVMTGAVDAVVGGYRNFELTQMALEGKPGRAFFPEEHGVPAYDELILVARRDRLDDPRLPRFLAAVERAALWITNNPEAGWKSFVAANPSLDDELNARAWKDTLPRFAKRPAALDRGRYERFATFLTEAGLIKSLPPITDYAVELR